VPALNSLITDWRISGPLPKVPTGHPKAPRGRRARLAREEQAGHHLDKPPLPLAVRRTSDLGIDMDQLRPSLVQCPDGHEVISRDRGRPLS
jgi:hypothetical protein